MKAENERKYEALQNYENTEKELQESGDHGSSEIESPNPSTATPVIPTEMPQR